MKKRKFNKKYKTYGLYKMLMFQRKNQFNIYDFLNLTELSHFVKFKEEIKEVCHISEFEKDVLDVMGSFMEINLDCVEKQNSEIDRLQNNWNELKKWLEEKQSLRNFSEENRTETAYYKLLRELSNKMQELEGNNE